MSSPKCPTFPCVSCQTPRSARTMHTRCPACIARDAAEAERARAGRAERRALQASLVRMDRRRIDAVRYTAKRIVERERDTEAGGSPYERAVRAIEQESGQHRSTWEYQLNSELTLEANRRAREIAGIPELPTCTPRGGALTQARQAAA